MFYNKCFLNGVFHSSTTTHCIAPGVRTVGHLPAGAAAVGRGAGPGRVLHHPLRGHVREDRHEDRHLRDPAPGGGY